MPSTSPFVIALSYTEGQILFEGSKQYTSPYCRVVRPRSFSLRLPAWTMSKSPSAWRFRGRWSPTGANGSIANESVAWKTNQGAGDRALVPPEETVEIKAMACELASRLGRPFSRLSNADIASEATVRGIVVSISVKMVWRYLTSDAINPWTVLQRKILTPNDFPRP